MDSAFPTAAYPGYTTAQLVAAVEAGRSTPAMLNEIERRAAVANGDREVMTPGERLRAGSAVAAQSTNTAQIVALRAASPLRSKARAVHDVDGLGLFDHARQPSLF